MKKVLCYLLLATMSISLVACGKKEENTNQSSASSKNTENMIADATHYFEPEYFENLPEELTYSGTQKFRGQSLFFIGNDENYTKTGIYEYSLESKKLNSFIEIDKQEIVDPTEESGEINSYAVNDNRLVYIYHAYYTDPAINDVDFSATTETDVYNYFINNWGYDNDMIKSELESDYYKPYKKEDGSFDYGGILKKLSANEYPTINKYYLIGKDFEGNELYNYELTNLEEVQEGCFAYVVDVALDNKDNVYVLSNSYGDGYDDYIIDVFDKDGNPGKEYKQSQYIEKFYNLKDGAVAIMQYSDDGGNEFRTVDPATATISDTPVFSTHNTSYGAIPFEDDKFLSMDGLGLKLLTNGQNESELYLKWLDSNILSGSIVTFGLLDGDKIALYLNHYTGNKNVSEIVVLNEVDKEKLLSKTQIKIATLYLSSDLEEAVVEFNKKNNDYHIDVATFNYEGDDYENYNNLLNNFMLSLATDNSIDVLALNDSSAYNHVINFAQKGLLIDLNPLIESDPKLNKEEFIQNLIDPLYYDGKLVALPSTLTISTLIGKKSDVGDKMGWDAKKAQEVLASKGEDAVFMLYSTKSEILENCMNLSYSEFVDVEKGDCDFDNETFVGALEFSNIFPEEIDWEDENYAANEPERVSKGKILTARCTLSDFDTIQNYQTVWNDDVTYIGYPSSGENNGALIWYDGLYGITKNCENPEIAWNLLSSMMKNPSSKPEYRDTYGPYNMFISPTKDNLDTYLDIVSENYEQSGYTNYWDNFEIEMKPLTEQMRQSYKDAVYSTTAVAGSVPTGVMDIIKEEASSYYSGQKSAEEVAKIVQSRVKIYLSETR